MTMRIVEPFTVLVTVVPPGMKIALKNALKLQLDIWRAAIAL